MDFSVNSQVRAKLYFIYFLFLFLPSSIFDGGGWNGVGRGREQYQVCCLMKWRSHAETTSLATGGLYLSFFKPYFSRNYCLILVYHVRISEKGVKTHQKEQYFFAQDTICGKCFPFMVMARKPILA